MRRLKKHYEALKGPMRPLRALYYKALKDPLRPMMPDEAITGLTKPLRALECSEGPYEALKGLMKPFRAL